jgi:predicted Zn-dependent peptidase
MFTEVREKRGLAYSVKTNDDYYTDTGSFLTYAGVEPKKALEALKVILKEYKKMTSIQHCMIKKEELKKAKEYFKGHFALGLEDTSDVGEFFGLDELYLGKTRTVERF